MTVALKSGISSELTLSDRLDAITEGAIASQRIVGAVTIVKQAGRTVYRRAFGHMDREAGIPMREDGVFRFASLTKPIVSAAAFSLIESGVIDLDTLISKHLPDFHPRLADGRAPRLTVRHLMTHTAGFSYGFLEPLDGPYHRAGVSDGLDCPGRAMEENLRRIATVPLAFAPGTRWSYSVATDVLGATMASASGLPLQEIVRDRITEPLGMRDSAFAVRPSERLVTPYGDGNPIPERMGDPHQVQSVGGIITYAPSRILEPTSFPSGGAGMAGTADDFITFLECLRTGGAPVLTANSVSALTHDAVGGLEVNLMGPGWGYGLGVAVLLDSGLAGTPQSPGTWHWSGAYGHSWFVDPSRELSIVSLTNTAIAGMIGSYPDALRDALYA